MRKKIIQTTNRISALLLTAVLFAGCGGTTDATGNPVTPFKAAPVKTAMLEEGRVEYEVPENFPAISVDLVGYLPEEEKKAVIRTRKLPETFVIMDAETGEEVFEGKIKPFSEADKDGFLTGIADFSGLTAEGTYVMEADYVGTSGKFVLRTGIYEDLLKDTFKRLHELRCGEICHKSKVSLSTDPDTQLDISGGWHTGEAGERDVVSGCLAAYDLMIAYQYHPSSFKDNTGIAESGNRIPDILDEVRYETDWLMKMQNPETGGVYSSVTLNTGTAGKKLYIDGEATRATVNFCVTLTHFSYIINKFDGSYSRKCLKAAGLAWKCLEANKDIVSDEQMYRAAVELYKATGYGVYKKVIDNYLSSNSDKKLESRGAVDAAITHMGTSRSANMTYCGNLMNRFMGRTHEKAALAADCAYMVESAELDPKELLRNTSELVVVDYIITSTEYLKLEKNYLHYLCGRNIKSELFLDYGNSPEAYAMLLILLGRLEDI